jgi:hypothetical protein
VAAVITRKDEPSAISTGVKKMWNSQTQYTAIVFQNLGSTRVEASRLPLIAPRVAAKSLALSIDAKSQRGIVAD